LEEQVGGLGFERDVANIDDDPRVAAEPEEFFRNCNVPPQIRPPSPPTSGPTGYLGGARSTAELCPPIPSEVFSVIPSTGAVGPSSSRGWPSATAGGAGMTLCW
jgi:hypothetical protein